MKTDRSIFQVLSYIFIFSTTILFSSCGGSSQGYEEEDDEQIEESGYEGDYCADVNYYNPNTGNSSNYTLNVLVEDNQLVTIYWPNGGWMDDDHFSPEELDDNGYCSFTSDKGYDYEVQISGSPCSYTSDTSPSEDDYDASTTCHQCGGSDYNMVDGLCTSCYSELNGDNEEDY
jgi:hypothetical protein